MFQQIVSTVAQYWQSGALFIVCLLLLSYLQRRYHSKANAKRQQDKNPSPRHLSTILTRYNNDRIMV